MAGEVLMRMPPGDWDVLLGAVRVDFVPGVGLTVTGLSRRRSGGGEALTIRVEVTALFNDYLEVKAVDSSGSAVGDAFPAAKPDKLRHDATLYAWPTTLTTVDTNKVTVGNGTKEFEWLVTPDAFAVGDRLSVTFIQTGLEVDSEPVWWEIDPGERKWGAQEVSS